VANYITNACLKRKDYVWKRLDFGFRVGLADLVSKKPHLGQKIDPFCGVVLFKTL
jgi:hypothetical protein